MTKPEGALCQTYNSFHDIQMSVGAQFPAYGSAREVSGSLSAPPLPQFYPGRESVYLPVWRMYLGNVSVGHVVFSL